MGDTMCSGKFSVVTLGCRSNQAEGESIASALEDRGWTLADGHVPLDLVVVVTCSITAVADQKARKVIRKARRGNPRAVVVACGCYVEAAASDSVRDAGVDILVGNGLKHRIPDLVEDFIAQGEFIEARRSDGDSKWDALVLAAPKMHSRAFVKIQDGCDHRCSYCIVPSVRGEPVSRPHAEIIEEVSRVAEFGCSEAILTGINIGRYRDGDNGLPSVISALSRVKGLERLRIGSIEPFAVTDELLGAFAAAENFCRHLHIPMQSGDDEILLSMRRGYDSAGFARVAARCRAALGDDVHLSTDLIVGYPGESEAAFERSLSLLDALAFGRIHVFPYSPRQGTVAEKLAGRLEGTAMKERVRQAVDFASRSLDAYAARWIGRAVEVLAEGRDGNRIEGWTRHYVRARCATGESRAVSFVPASCREGILSDE